MGEAGSQLELVTVGETMLRLTAPPGSSLERAYQLDVEVAGAESNVAVAYARLGHRAGWVSRLPATALGRMVANRIQEHGVDVSRVLWADKPARLGIYYLEASAPPRPGRVIYDRADSAFAQIDPDEVDWTYVAGARRLHLTGITPVLSPSCLALVRRALAEAKKAGQSVSFDLNYRSTLWSPADAAATLGDLLSGMDILFTSTKDVRALFNFDSSPEEQAALLGRRFQAKVVVVTCGAEGAAAWDGLPHRVPAVPAVEIDRLGRGDAFVAGFLHRIREGDTQEALRYGAALAALKQTYRGDVVWTTPEEVDGIVRSAEQEIDR